MHSTFRKFILSFSALLVLVAALCLVPANIADADDGAPIKIVNPHLLSGKDVPAVRTPLGIPNDYKPWLAQLKNGQLMIVAFCYGPIPGSEGRQERALFWRSSDEGKTWGDREERRDVPGREFGTTVLEDGTIIMTCHFLTQDVNNKVGHTHSQIYRSVDNGATWSRQRIGPEGFPPGAETMADWNAFQMPDPKSPDKLITALGISYQYGGAEQAPKHVYLWQSRNSGATWDKSIKCDTAGWYDVDGFFSQAVTHRTESGKLLHPVRVDRTGPHWHIPGTPEKLKVERGDNGDRSMLWESTDNGKTWRKHGKDGSFGTYGEMYTRFLKLQDGRLLLTFTVRSNSTDGYALGPRAILSDDDGETWDFKRDRIVIDAQNIGASGGSFGNTLQMSDGTLVSCYSYRALDEKTHVEAVRWRLPEVAKLD